MPLRLLARPSGLLIPITDLGLKTPLSRDLIVGDDLGLELSLLMGHDGREPRLLQVDGSRALRVTMAGQTLAGGVFIRDPGTGAQSSVEAPVDGVGSNIGVDVNARLQAFNNVTWDRLRTASASNQGSTSGVGALVSTPPSEWAITSAPAAGSQASATRAAGGAGVRHILKGFGFAAGSIVAPALTALLVNVRDGASGAGTILKSIVVVIAAVVGQNLPPIEISGLNLVGSANTALTVEFSAALANLSQSVSLQGYDTI